MPQRFLSIKNLEKYQTNRKINPPWFKLYRVMFGDPEFIKLTPAYRFLYIGLIHLAVESGNRIYNDDTFILQRLYIPTSIAYTSSTDGILKVYKGHTKLDLTPLYRAGFLYTTNLSRVLSETETETETETEREGEGEGEGERHTQVDIKPNGKARKRDIADEDKPTDKHRDFAKSLGVDVGPEWGKFKNYCLAHGRQYVNFEAAFRNWLANSLEMKGGKR